MSPPTLPPPSADPRPVPSRTAAVALSRRLLADQGTRFQHVCRSGEVAQELAALFSADDHRLLVAAATVHDIGYSPVVADTGFHQLDGGRFLLNQGYPLRLAGLVAHHSHAQLLAPDDGIRRLLEAFPRDESLLADGLVFADMHSDPYGRRIHVEQRLADIEQRHPGPHAKQRTLALQASIRRVRAALSQSQPVRYHSSASR